ncbi:MAG: RNA-binding protein [Cenarchaeum symbiont of Oopsacas minuta]|nr:RNA-binding protein [Cenarchaeum symbiont of Oopsacas minuta]
MKSNPISKSESIQTLREISSQWGIELPKTKNLMVYHITDDALFISGDGLKALKIGKTYVPFLTYTIILEKFPRIIVDMGAIKFVCNGANIMRPGVTKFSGEFESGKLVCIAEESKNTFLSVGKALVSSSDARTMKKGHILENLHYVSDKYWDIGRQIYN